MQGAWDMQHNFEKRMAELLRQIEEQKSKWKTAKFAGTYVDAKQQSLDFAEYKRTFKRKWVAEKSELVSLLGNIKTKLGTYGLKDYEPPAHLNLANLDQVWNTLLQAENKRSMLINQTIREYYHPQRFVVCFTNVNCYAESKKPSAATSPKQPTNLPSASPPFLSRSRA
jgi:hypothetical protein